MPRKKRADIDKPKQVELPPPLRETIPVWFDLYAPLTAEQRWLLQCHVAYADADGCCWLTDDQLVACARMREARAMRDRAELCRLELLTPVQRTDGAVGYRVDERFLDDPSCPAPPVLLRTAS
jgi:hypothetical protein